MSDIQFTLNGKTVTYTGSAADRLLDVLRDTFHCTSVKCGCKEGECGACSVLLDGKLINSCCVAMGAVEGSTVVTLEGYRETERFAALDKAFAEVSAVQCGFCIPGFLMTAVEILDRGVLYSDDELRKLLSGHLCRCTGYENIFKAVKKTMLRRLGKLDDPFLNT